MTEAALTETSAIGIDRMQARLDRSPFNGWLGIRLTAVTPAGVEMEILGRPEFISTPERQIIHGGILASLVDAAAIYAVIARTGVLQTTVDMRVDYHAPAPVGPLRASGTIVRLGKTLSCAEARIMGAEGKLLASGRGIFASLEMPA